jgi:hypothetical protein
MHNFSFRGIFAIPKILAHFLLKFELRASHAHAHLSVASSSLLFEFELVRQYY